MPTIAENIDRVRDRIVAAAHRVGRRADEITLIAVTKTVEAERVAEAVAAGVMDLGENYYQEARAKVGLFGSGIRWHFIGHLQSNKARQIVGAFHLVHSVDSEHLAVEIGRRAANEGITQPVLIEVKLDPAAGKTGCDPKSAPVLAERIARIPGVDLQGYMGMAPFGEDAEISRPSFVLLRHLFERLPEQNRRVLSMGMTGDFEVAVEEGATHVRIGTAVFGKRGF